MLRRVVCILNHVAFNQKLGAAKIAKPEFPRIVQIYLPAALIAN